MVKKIITLTLIFCFLASCNSTKKMVNVNQQKIIDLNGQTLKLKGVNLGNWLLPEGYILKLKDCDSPRKLDQAIRELIGNTASTEFWDNYLANYITEPDIEWLSKTGINLVRLPFDYRLLTSDDYLGRDYHGFEYIDKTIEWCKKYNLYVLLDMHGAPGGQTGANIDNSDGYPWLMLDQGMQQKTCEVWQNIAKRYKNEPTVIGYNLLNEPVAHFFKEDNIDQYLEPLYKKITASIREVDKKHLIFIGGSMWETDFSIFNKPFDDKLVYSFHKYWQPVVQEQVQSYVDYREKYNVPIFMGESGENEDIWVNDFRALLDKNDIHWTFWPYKKMDNTRAPMQFKLPKNYGKFIAYADSNRSSYDQIRQLKDSITGIDRKSIQIILNEMVENMKFENCTPNSGYCKALLFNGFTE